MLLISTSILYFTIFTLVEFCTSRDLDYSEEKYNKKKSCTNSKIISKLKKQNSRNNGSCTKIKVKWRDIAPYLCKTKLKNKLYYEICRTRPYPRFTATKHYMYCYNRGVIECCFESFECVDSHGVQLWNRNIDTRKQVLNEYLKFGLEVLPDEYAYKHGFRICKRAIEPNGLELCEKECEKEENSDFANKCIEDPKANFKCCIIRKNVGCDACGICCILPVCTTPGIKEELNTFKFYMNETLSPAIDIDKKAAEIRRHLKSIKQPYWKAIAHYFNEDLEEFCLKTDQNGNKQSYYNMTAYRAFTKKEKLDVPTFPIPEGDDLFNPESRKKFASSKGSKMISNIFGYDKCYKIPTRPEETKCFNTCKKLEKSKFAKKCNKEGSQVFKCCVEKHYLIDAEESQKDVMKYLVKQKFITKPLQEICTGNKCKFCCVLSVCTKKNADGSLEHVFNVKSESKKFDRHIYGKCRAFIRKPKRLKILKISYNFNMTEYRQAYTKDMLCEVSAYKQNEELEIIRVKSKNIKINQYCDRKRNKMKNGSEVKKERQSKKKREKRKKKKKWRQSKKKREKGKKKREWKKGGKGNIKLEKQSKKGKDLKIAGGKKKGKKKSEWKDLNLEKQSKKMKVLKIAV